MKIEKIAGEEKISKPREKRRVKVDMHGVKLRTDSVYIPFTFPAEFTCHAMKIKQGLRQRGQRKQ